MYSTLFPPEEERITSALHVPGTLTGRVIALLASECGALLALESMKQARQHWIIDGKVRVGNLGVP